MLCCSVVVSFPPASTTTAAPVESAAPVNYAVVDVVIVLALVYVYLLKTGVYPNLEDVLGECGLKNNKRCIQMQCQMIVDWVVDWPLHAT